MEVWHGIGFWQNILGWFSWTLRPIDFSETFAKCDSVHFWHCNGWNKSNVTIRIPQLRGVDACDAWECSRLNRLNQAWSTPCSNTLEYPIVSDTVPHSQDILLLSETCLDLQVAKVRRDTMNGRLPSKPHEVASAKYNRKVLIDKYVRWMDTHWNPAPVFLLLRHFQGNRAHIIHYVAVNGLIIPCAVGIQSIFWIIRRSPWCGCHPFWRFLSSHSSGDTHSASKVAFSCNNVHVIIIWERNKITIGTPFPSDSDPLVGVATAWHA